MKMDFSTLAFYNPWWDEKSKISNYTFHLVDEYESSSFKRDYNGLFDLSGNNLYIVRGPRQIGKSTLLKFTITNLLKSGERRSVLYLPLDTISRADELRGLLIQYLQFSRNEKKRYIFIDEITMVDQWQRAVKEVRDNTEMGSDFFALSGSSASDLKRSSERLPGRKGQSGADIVLLPLTFREYLSCKKVNGLPKCRPEEILKMVPADSFELLIKNEILKTEFFNYIASGGFPAAIEAYAKGESSDTLLRTFWEILIGNIERYGLSRAKLIQVLALSFLNSAVRLDITFCLSSSFFISIKSITTIPPMFSISAVSQSLKRPLGSCSMKFPTHRCRRYCLQSSHRLRHSFCSVYVSVSSRG